MSANDDNDVIDTGVRGPGRINICKVPWKLTEGSGESAWHVQNQPLNSTKEVTPGVTELHQQNNDQVLNQLVFEFKQLDRWLTDLINRTNVL